MAEENMDNLDKSYELSENITIQMITTTESRMLSVFGFYIAYVGIAIQLLVSKWENFNHFVFISISVIVFGIIAIFLIRRYLKWKSAYIQTLRKVSEYYLPFVEKRDDDHLPPFLRKDKPIIAGPIDEWYSYIILGIIITYGVLLELYICKNLDI